MSSSLQYARLFPSKLSVHAMRFDTALLIILFLRVPLICMMYSVLACLSLSLNFSFLQQQRAPGCIALKAALYTLDHG